MEPQKRKWSNFDLEELFGVDLDIVDSVISNMDNNVTIHRRPKNNGDGFRIITAPSDTLSNIQSNIFFKFFKMYRVSKSAHGFVKHRSIVTNAKVHLRPKSVFKEDIKSFFDNVKPEHLQNCIFGNKNVCRLCKNYRNMQNGICNPSIYHNRNVDYKSKCEELKAVFIPEYCDETGYQSLFKRVIDLCTYNSSAPQGFSTSPVIANIIMRGFDIKMEKLAKDNDLAYTRYADDIVFTSKTHNKDQLKRIVRAEIARSLWGFGFKVNKVKTTSKNSGSRIKICGVVVNEKLNVQRDDLRLFRAKVHNATVKNPGETTVELIRKLKGYASFVMSVNKEKGNKYMKQLCDFHNANFA